MEIKTIKNIIYNGSCNRSSLLDVYSPIKDSCFPLVIFVHGFKGFKDWGHFPLLLESISRSGFHVVSFNSSHNGGTTDNPIDFPDLDAFSENTYSKELYDINQIINWAESQKKIEYSSISIIGHSRGGGLAVLAASKLNKINKLITWAAVDDFMDRLPSENDLSEWKSKGVLYVKNGRTKQNMPMKYAFVQDLLDHSESLSIPLAAKSVDIPTLIIHGENDETVKLESAKKLKSNIKGAILEIIINTGHTFGGVHPFLKEELPEGAIDLLKKTVAFLKL